MTCPNAAVHLDHPQLNICMVVCRVWSGLVLLFNFFSDGAFGARHVTTLSRFGSLTLFQFRPIMGGPKWLGPPREPTVRRAAQAWSAGSFGATRGHVMLDWLWKQPALKRAVAR